MKQVALGTFKEYIHLYTQKNKIQALTSLIVILTIMAFNNAYNQTINFFLPTDSTIRVYAYWFIFGIYIFIGFLLLCCVRFDCSCYKRFIKYGEEEDEIPV